MVITQPPPILHPAILSDSKTVQQSAKGEVGQCRPIVDRGLSHTQTHVISRSCVNFNPSDFDAIVCCAAHQRQGLRYSNLE